MSHHDASLYTAKKLIQFKKKYYDSLKKKIKKCDL